LDPLNVTLLHLYFSNYIIMEEMESIGNGEDFASTTKKFFHFYKYQTQSKSWPN
jgi:hypothetical protein